MNPAPDCDKVLLVQAELDGELGAAEAAALAAHRAQCPICEAAAAELVHARALIGDGLYQPMPDDVRRRVMAQIAAAQAARRPADSSRGASPLLGGWRQWWSQWRSAAGGVGPGAGRPAPPPGAGGVPRPPGFPGASLAP